MSSAIHMGSTAVMQIPGRKAVAEANPAAIEATPGAIGSFSGAGAAAVGGGASGPPSTQSVMMSAARLQSELLSSGKQ